MRTRVYDYLRKLKKRKTLWLLFIVLVLIWLNNTSLFVDRPATRPALVAHAGLGQTYDLKGVKWNTNTAAIIHKPEHPFIENTIPSMKAAFDYGADVVEFDIRLTADNQLAVFHDDRLEYRTDGTGYVGDHTMDELRRLDVGYGYTADSGKTFPLRGKGKGLMVSVEDVFRTFPGRKFLVHIKDGGEKVGPVLLGFLGTLDDSTVERVAAYGNDPALDLLRERYPSMKILSRAKMIRAGLMYLLVGWTGIMPGAIHNMEIHLPLKYARFLWGWPDKFLDRMDAVNTRVVLVQYVNGWSDGFDSGEALTKLPPNYSGGVWTNRVDVVGPLLNE